MMKPIFPLFSWVLLAALAMTACSSNNPSSPGTNGQGQTAPTLAEDADPSADAPNTGLAPDEEPEATLRKPPGEPPSETRPDSAAPGGDSGAASEPAAAPAADEEARTPSLFRSLGRALGRGMRGAAAGNSAETGETDSTNPNDVADTPEAGILEANAPDIESPDVEARP